MATTRPTYKDLGLCLLQKRGTKAKVAQYTGPWGEIVIDDECNVAVQNGTTAGGVELAKKSDIVASGFSVNDSVIYVNAGTAGDDSNDGSEAHPVKTLAQAIKLSNAAAGTHKIYVAAGTYAALTVHNGEYAIYCQGNITLASIDVQNSSVIFHKSATSSDDLTITVSGTGSSVTFYRAGSGELRAGLVLDASNSAFRVSFGGDFINHGTVKCDQMHLSRGGGYTDAPTTSSETPKTIVQASSATGVANTYSGSIFVSNGGLLYVQGHTFNADYVYVRRASSALLTAGSMTFKQIYSVDASSVKIGGDNPTAQRKCDCTLRYMVANRGGSILVTATAASGTVAAAPTTLTFDKDTNGDMMYAGDSGTIEIDGVGSANSSLVTLVFKSGGTDVDHAIYAAINGNIYIHAYVTVKISGPYSSPVVSSLMNSSIYIINCTFPADDNQVSQGVNSSGAAAGGQAYEIDYNSLIRFRNNSGTLPGAAGTTPIVGTNGSNYYGA